MIIGKYAAAQAGTVELTRGLHEISCRTLRPGASSERGLARRHQSVCERIGIHDIDPERHKNVRHFRLSAADSTGEANDVRHVIGRAPNQPGR